MSLLELLTRARLGCVAFLLPDSSTGGTISQNPPPGYSPKFGAVFNYNVTSTGLVSGVGRTINVATPTTTPTVSIPPLSFIDANGNTVVPLSSGNISGAIALSGGQIYVANLNWAQGDVLFLHICNNSYSFATQPYPVTNCLLSLFFRPMFLW
jgi:hypothetical protein